MKDGSVTLHRPRRIHNVLSWKRKGPVDIPAKDEVASDPIPTKLKSFQILDKIIERMRGL